LLSFSFITLSLDAFYERCNKRKGQQEQMRWK